MWVVRRTDYGFQKKQWADYVDKSVPMHTACFVSMCGVHETVVNLTRVITVWYLNVRWLRRRRAERALGIVYKWLSNEHYPKIAETKYKEYWCRFCIRSWAEEAAVGMPMLVWSSSESETSDISEESDTAAGTSETSLAEWLR